MHIGGNDGDLVALVRIGKAGHTGKLQEAVAEPMPARCTKLQHQVGQLAADAGKKLLTCQNLLIQPFAQTFRTVTAKADGFVVIDLHVVNAVGTQKINDSVRQILLHLGLAHIPKMRRSPAVMGRPSRVSSQSVLVKQSGSSRPAISNSNQMPAFIPAL